MNQIHVSKEAQPIHELCHWLWIKGSPKSLDLPYHSFNSCLICSVFSKHTAPQLSESLPIWPACVYIFIFTNIKCLLNSYPQQSISHTPSGHRSLQIVSLHRSIPRLVPAWLTSFALAVEWQSLLLPSSKLSQRSLRSTIQPSAKPTSRTWRNFAKLSILTNKSSVINNNQNTLSHLARWKRDRNVSDVEFVDCKGLNKDRVPRRAKESALAFFSTQYSHISLEMVMRPWKRMVLLQGRGKESMLENLRKRLI